MDEPKFGTRVGQLLDESFALLVETQMKRRIFTILLILSACFLNAQNCPCGNNVNLFTNGNFESGELLPAETQMNQWNVNCNLEFGCYSVVTSASELGGQFNGWAHGGNFFMFVDGQDFSPGNQPQLVWAQTVDCLIPGETYSFKFWLLGCSGFGDIFVLDASVVANGNTTVLSENTLINTMMDNSNAPLEWQQYSYNWTATAETATFRLDQISFNSNGFDFGLDDIRLIGDSNAALDITSSTNAVSCTGEPGVIEIMPLNGNGPYTFELTNASGTLSTLVSDDSGTFNVIDPGTYIIEVSDNGNCSAEIQVDLIQDQQMQVDLETEDPTCLQDGFIQLNPISGEAPYSIQINGELENDQLTPITEGFYEVVVSDNNGCQFDTTLVFEIDNPVVADFDLAMEGELIEILNESSNSDEFTWWLNGMPFSHDENPVMNQAPEPGVYSFTLLAEDSISGCQDSMMRSITIGDDFAIYIPNCITADEDGINDYFFVDGSVDELTRFTCSIYNRWGEVVYTSDNPGMKWIANFSEGNYFAQDGVYNYRIEYQRKGRLEVEVITGHLTVLR